MPELPGLAREMVHAKPPTAISALLLLLFALVASGASCSGANRDSSANNAFRSASLPETDLRLLVVTDMTGHLEPCGCTSRPLGGLDRLAAAVQAARNDGRPTLFIAAGDLFFDAGHDTPDSAVEGASTQEIWKAETLAALLSEMGLDAAAPGPLDRQHGADRLTALAEIARFPMLGTSESPVATLRQVGELKVGVVAAVPLENESPNDAMERARAGASEMRAAGAEFVVVLASLPRREVRRLASTPEIDFIVVGGLDDSEPHLPSAGEAVILHASHQGQGLLVVDAMKRGEGEWTDLSDWTRRQALERAASEIERLRARIEGWEASESVQEADLARQRARLRELERERETMARPPEPGSRAFTAQWIELDPNHPRDSEVTAAMDAYFQRVNAHNREAFAQLLPEPAPPGQPHYIGSQACSSCHQPAYDWWRTTPHGHAYRTLQEVHKEYNLSCVGCHVTGYNQPGGSTVSHVDALADVGCENCHGPGSMHAESPADAAVNVRRSTPETVCVRCHNTEHSDRFVYQSYLPLLRAPGHGMPPSESE